MSIISILQKKKQEVESTFTNLVKDISVDEQTYNERMNVCNGCESYVKLLHQCRECGCIMNLKARLKKAKCPLSKW